MNKTQRSVLLFAHLLVLCFVIGDYFVWSDSAPTGSVLCRSARFTAIIFYKPFLASTFYCLNFLADTGGWMLWHNPFTDSIVAVLMILLFLWTLCSVIISFPVLVSFFFFTIIFFIPPIVYLIFEGELVFLHKNKVSKLSEVQKKERDAAIILLKRLSFYSLFACLVFGIYLYPFYEGEGYVSVLKRAGQSLVPSLHFWAPKFSVSFSWPHVSLPSQIALGLSLAVLSMEYILMLGQLLLEYAYPKGFAFDDMYTEGFGEPKEDEAEETTATEEDLDADEEGQGLKVEAGGFEAATDTSQEAIEMI